MKLWRKAAGVLKDKNSILAANFSRRSSLRNPDIDEAVIKATSHNETRVDYRNSQRVFELLRTSPAYLKPLIWSISVRMDKTRSWIVALKGLMLVHGVFCRKVPAVQKIGRLPFDLSHFEDASSSDTPNKTWAYNAFIQAYYAFLDQKSTFIFLHAQELKALEKKLVDLQSQRRHTLHQELVWLQSLQKLLSMLLQIRPQTEDIMIGVLVLEAMDCIIIETIDMYGRIGNGITRIMKKIHSFGKEEAEMALKILKKTAVQDNEVVAFFEFFRKIGVLNATEFPKFEQVSEKDIQELENRMKGMLDESEIQEKNEGIMVKMIESGDHKRNDSTSSLQTVVTDEWEKFDDSPKKTASIDHFAGAIVCVSPPLLHPKLDDLPDLITFD